uniref:Uncharacterized protein n=1 Tax=Oryza brachyantha TaxID=4533 RepID=J3LJC6_ORYBR
MLERVRFVGRKPNRRVQIRTVAPLDAKIFQLNRGGDQPTGRPAPPPPPPRCSAPSLSFGHRKLAEAWIAARRTGRLCARRRRNGALASSARGLVGLARHFGWSPRGRPAIGFPPRGAGFHFTALGDGVSGVAPTRTIGFHSSHFSTAAPAHSFISDQHLRRAALIPVLLPVGFWTKPMLAVLFLEVCRRHCAADRTTRGAAPQAERRAHTGTVSTAQYEAGK